VPRAVLSCGVVGGKTVNDVQEKVADVWDSGAASYDLQTKRNGYFNFVSAWVGKHGRDFDDRDQCRILDLGCGSGLNVKLLRELRQGISAEGIDISEAMILGVRAENIYEQLYCQTLDKAFPQIKSNSADLVIAFGFLEFLTDVWTCLSECQRVLKDEGTLWATFQRFENDDSGSPPRHIVASGVRITGYTAGEILHMMQRLGFLVISMDPVVGYITKNGFQCPYFVLRAKKHAKAIE
jgi:predicted TPR repeat methyltransferase